MRSASGAACRQTEKLRPARIGPNACLSRVVWKRFSRNAEAAPLSPRSRAQEAALLAELNRQSARTPEPPARHLQQFGKSPLMRGPRRKELDFFFRKLHREANTMLFPPKHPESRAKRFQHPLPRGPYGEFALKLKSGANSQNLEMSTECRRAPLDLDCVRDRWFGEIDLLGSDSPKLPATIAPRSMYYRRPRRAAAAMGMLMLTLRKRNSTPWSRALTFWSTRGSSQDSYGSPKNWLEKLAQKFDLVARDRRARRGSGKTKNFRSRWRFLFGPPFPQDSNSRLRRRALCPERDYEGCASLPATFHIFIHDAK